MATTPSAMEQGHLAGVPMGQGADERDVVLGEGARELGLEGAVDHLHHLERDAGDGARGGEDGRRRRGPWRS